MAIRDEEELERLAGLQLRDSLVRGLKVSEQIQASLKGGLHPSYSTSSVDAALNPTKSSMFACRYHLNQEQNPDATCSIKHHYTPSEYEQRMLGMTRATPLHSLPGSMSAVKLDQDSLHPSKAHPNGHWSISKPNLHKRYHARTSIQSSSVTYCNPSLAPSRPSR